MAVLHSQVFFPGTLPELFSAWSRYPDAVPFAGGIEILGGQGKTRLTLPPNILSLDKLDELHRISRTERYLEIGAMVKINEIINLGKIVPEVLRQTLKGIASPQVRNVATLGGNICHISRRMDVSAPMVALDARYELRTAQGSRWLSAVRFSTFSGSLAFNPQELLTRIRIPLEQWNYSIYKKFENPASGTESGGVALFLARMEKNILTDIRMVFAEKLILRDKNSEAFLAGKRLPLDRKDAQHYGELWRNYLSAIELDDGLLKAKLLNFIEATLIELTY
ncbi:MAG: FAD binding domain-containing protein [Spirochaetaceae bacterium]|jgi:CO/xanthine dehydrogenase FAD-binding subunit|nr:FAD binding domain-containing protein [Spirochaetaceae bacterium]